MIAPIVQLAAPVTAPVVQAAAPVTAPVVQLAAPVTAPDVQAAAPVTAPDVQAAAPVVKAAVPVTGPMLQAAAVVVGEDSASTVETALEPSNRVDRLALMGPHTAGLALLSSPMTEAQTGQDQARSGGATSIMRSAAASVDSTHEPAGPADNPASPRPALPPLPEPAAPSSPSASGGSSAKTGRGLTSSPGAATTPETPSAMQRTPVGVVAAESDAAPRPLAIDPGSTPD